MATTIQAVGAGGAWKTGRDKQPAGGSTGSRWLSGADGQAPSCLSCLQRLSLSGSTGLRPAAMCCSCLHLLGQPATCQLVKPGHVPGRAEMQRRAAQQWERGRRLKTCPPALGAAFWGLLQPDPAAASTVLRVLPLQGSRGAQPRSLLALLTGLLHFQQAGALDLRQAGGQPRARALSAAACSGGGQATGALHGRRGSAEWTPLQGARPERERRPAPAPPALMLTLTVPHSVCSASGSGTALRWRARPPAG